MNAFRLAPVGAAWILGLGSFALSVLAQGGRFSARLDVLTHFVPIYAVAAVVALVLFFVAGRGLRTAGLTVSALGLACAAAFMFPEYVGSIQSRREVAGPNGSLKLIQFNAWGGNPRGDEAVSWLVAQRPDVIVLEEAGRLRDRLIAKGYQASCMSCGAVIFSRAEANRIYSEPEAESRHSYLSAATFGDSLGEFTVVGIHRPWPTRFRIANTQAAALRAFLRNRSKGRLIIAGDFNSTPWSFARRREDREFGLIRRTRALFTWPAARVSHNRLPAPFPYMPIDHVYAGPGWATVEVERGPRLGSDHYPVVVTLTPTDHRR